MCLSLLYLPWGDTGCHNAIDVMQFLSLPATLKWIDTQFPIRAKTIWCQLNLKHLDPASSGHHWCIQHCDTPGVVYQSYLRHDSPRDASIRSRLRLQRAHTNQYKIKFNVPDPSMTAGEHCAVCNVMETIEHVLLHCPRYSAARIQARRKLLRLHSSPVVSSALSSPAVSPSDCSPASVPFPFTVATLLGFVPSSQVKSPLLPSVFEITSSFLSAIRAVRFL